MWLLMALMTLLTLLSTSVRADIYKCPDGKGGTIFQDQACAEGETAPMLQSLPPSASPPMVAPQPSTPAIPPSGVPQDDLPADKCLTIENIKSRIGEKNRVYTEVLWAVEVTNRCWRDFAIWVRYSLFAPGGEFEFIHRLERLYVRSRHSGASTGRVLVSPPSMMNGATARAKITFGAAD